MENPYEAPSPSSGDVVRRRSNFVNHVPIVAVLMMVQGGFEILMSLFLLAMTLFASLVEQPGAVKNNSLPAAVFGVLGLVVLIGACLKLFAGWQNYHFRGRILGFLALGSALASLGGCYCFPTAVALALYGLIVYLHDDVSQAFAMGRRGSTPEQIKAAFSDPMFPPAT